MSRPQLQLYFKLLSDNATLPTRGSEEAAGLDLYAAAPVTVEPLGKALVPLDIAVDLPAGHYARIAPRSGLAVRNHIGVGAGVVDRDFRGNISVVLFNHDAKERFQVNVGDRIAQLILEKISVASPVQVTELTETRRGSGGFGSTGK